MKRRRWIYFAIATVLVFVGIRIYTAPYMQIVHRQHQAFDAAYREYSSAILAQDYAKAYTFGGQDFRSALSEPEFVAEQQSLETRWGKLDSSSIENFHIDGHGDPMEWKANLRELRHYKNGNVHLLYEFRVENGQWKLFGYQEHD